MEHPGFFERAGPFALGIVAEAVSAKPAEGSDPGIAIKDVRPLTARAMTSFRNPKYLPLFAKTAASACLVAPKFAGHVPAGTAGLITPELYRAFARALLFIRTPANPGRR
jgi:UDP-3-O-[3-hydroxymyristoyl] glucosamine N-acyltransferase